ncbi:MAG TPA: hypothetical protein VHG91_16295 [Longimicrobium sp.]|nr:hypothetical protein [Longimicrobium sp.]
MPLLEGVSLFLSASVPSPARAEEFNRVPHAQVEIEGAVVALARAVLSEGGRLVFGGHPSISPLVASVAGEYAGDGGEGARVVIHQLEAFRTQLVDATVEMAKMGWAEIRWHPVHPSEQGHRPEPGKPPFPESLRRMRQVLLAETGDLAAMVCVGGMEGVIQEAVLFRDRVEGTRPCFAVHRSGGAAKILAEREREWVRAIDDEVLGPDDGAAGRRYVPYPLIMQMLVREIARSR